MDCKGAPLTEFVLRTEGSTWENKKYSYHFKCLQGVDVGKSEVMATSVCNCDSDRGLFCNASRSLLTRPLRVPQVEEDGGGNLIFLDRLNVDCGDG